LRRIGHRFQSVRSISIHEQSRLQRTITRVAVGIPQQAAATHATATAAQETTTTAIAAATFAAT
jgi:hypothetical protein